MGAQIKGAPRAAKEGEELVDMTIIPNPTHPVEYSPRMG